MARRRRNRGSGAAAAAGANLGGALLCLPSFFYLYMCEDLLGLSRSMKIYAELDSKDSQVAALAP
jgi:hypothetical protein